MFIKGRNYLGDCGYKVFEPCLFVIPNSVAAQGLNQALRVGLYCQPVLCCMFMSCPLQTDLHVNYGPLVLNSSAVHNHSTAKRH